MNKKLNFLITFSIFIFLGCKSLSKIKNIETEREFLTESNYEELNGNYNNYPKEFIGGIAQTPKNYHPETSIIGLYGNDFDYSYRLPERDEKNRTTTLKFINEKRLEFTLYQNDSVVGKKIIKGKLNLGYFYSKSKLEFYPFFPIAFGYGYKRFRIGKSNNLIILDYYVNQVFAGMAGETSKGEFSAIFEKKK